MKFRGEVAGSAGGSSGIGPIKLLQKRFAWLLPVAWLLPAVAFGFSTPTRQTPGVLGEYALGRRDGESVELPRQLTEISGLAVSEGGRVWAHDDERAIISELDPSSGEIVQSFSLGDPVASGDFEGIASVGDRLFLITSGGELYEFRAAAEGTTVPFARYRGLRQRNCEVEGLDHDASTNTLLLACKTTSGRALRDRLVVFGFSLDRMTALDQPVFAAPFDFLKGFDLDDELNPSGVALHPIANTVFILAARQNLIVELARDGTPLAARKLSGRNHRQAEGIAFLPDGTLIITDEGGGDRAKLTRYSARESH